MFCLAYRPMQYQCHQTLFPEAGKKVRIAYNMQLLQIFIKEIQQRWDYECLFVGQV
jgi:hypothetical protein